MMKNKTKIIFVLTLIMIIIGGIINFYCSTDTIKPQFELKICTDEYNESFSLWENEDGDYIVFLPGFVKFKDLTINLKTDHLIYINNILLQQDLCCDKFQPNQTYEIMFQKYGKTYTRNISFKQSSGVATMFIDTESGSMDYIHAQKGNEEKGQLRLYEKNGNINYTGDLEFIKGRGNSTWDYYDKKPYNIKTKTEANLMGMGSAKKWILLANATDSSNLRNKIVYDFAREVEMAYSPDSEWVDLYLNGEYVGLYLLCERNEIHTERININENTGILVSVEKEDRLINQNYPYILTDEKQAIRIHNLPNKTMETYEEIAEKWQAVENAILAQDDTDEISGMSLQELIDMKSWAKKYLIEEIFGNIDGCYLSQYFYYENKDSKVYAGPVWDYDKAIGNPSVWQLVNPQTMYANRYYAESEYHTPWFHYLYQKEDFYDKIVYYYKTCFLDLMTELIEEKIDAYVSEIELASEMNRIRWFSKTENLLSEAQYIKTFLKERITFLNNIWLENVSYNFVKIDQGLGSFYAYYAVPSGGFVDFLPDCSTFNNDKMFIGWYYCNTDEPFDPDQPIYEDIEIYAKWKETSSKRMKKIGKLIPLGIIFVLGTTLLITDIRRTKRNG